MPQSTAARPAEITAARIKEAYRLIKPYIRRTPVLEAQSADFQLPDTKLFFKLEFLQHSGSFKARGAFMNLLSRDIPEAGVVAATGGNHGAAVAYAAMKLGKRATIFVPSVTTKAKLDRIRGYGAELVIGGDLYADALQASQQWAAKSGALPIHAYDQVETMLGQGSVGLEFEEQAPELDTLLVAVGGGGLIGGIASWYDKRIKIIGVEPVASPTLTRALEAGRPVDAEAGGIASDSLSPRRVGELMFPIAQTMMDRMILVPDADIQNAQAALWDVLRVVTEPGGAAAFAAVLGKHYQPNPGERVGILLCGGNTTAVDFGSVRS